MQKFAVVCDSKYVGCSEWDMTSIHFMGNYAECKKELNRSKKVNKWASVGKIGDSIGGKLIGGTTRVFHIVPNTMILRHPSAF